MPYRTTNTPAICIICSKTTPRSCRNCNTPHCETHLLEASCAGCTNELWAMERRSMKKVGLAYGAVALTGVALAVGSVALVPVLGGLAAGAVLMKRIAPPIARRSLATRELTPSSRPLLETDIATEPKLRPSTRPRPNALVGVPRRQIRAVFMTRGGYFYQ